jgi:hypothetical protein
MVVRVMCLGEDPGEYGWRGLERIYPRKNVTFGVQAGAIYVVYGLVVDGDNVWLNILSRSGYLVSAPSFLFSVVDGRVSSLWNVYLANEVVRIGPPLLARDYVFDDLVEGVPEVVALFAELRTSIETEAGSPSIVDT